MNKDELLVRKPTYQKPKEITLEDFGLSKINPHERIENPQETLKQMEAIFGAHPQQVIEFALGAIGSLINEGLGIEILSYIIKQKGWDFLIEEVIHFKSNAATPEASLSTISAFRECAHKLGNPSDLPIEKIEQLLASAKSDLEWINLKSLVESRKRIEALENFDGAMLEQVAQANEIPFWDINKVIEAAEKIISEDPEEYYILLQQLYDSVDDMWGSDDEAGSPIVKEAMDKWESLSPRQLLENIYPVFSFNILTRHKTHQEIKENFILSETELKEILKKSLKENPEVFYHAQWLKESNDKYAYLTRANFDYFNLIPLLGKFAEAEGKTENEDKFGYALNSTVIPIARHTFALYSPTGRLLTLFDDREKTQEKFQNTEKIMHIAHFLSHKNRLMERQYSSHALAFAACLCHWEAIPGEIKNKLKDSFERSNADLDALIKIGSGGNFENIVDLASEYEPLLYANLSRDLVVFIQAELDKRTEGLGVLHQISPQELMEDIYQEYGKSKINEETIAHYLNSLNFDAVRFLKESLDFDLSLISKREFFALITFLDNKQGGEGFEKLRKFVGETPDPQFKANRIKCFLSLDQGGPEMGEKIISIGENLKDQPEIANLLFAEYAKMVDSADKSAEEATALYDKLFYEKRVDRDQIFQAILGRAGRLLIEANNELRQENDPDHKEKIIKKLITSLSKERESQTLLVQELQEIALKLNQDYADIYREYDDLQHTVLKQEIIEKEFGGEGSAEDREDYEDYLDIMRRPHPSMAYSVNEAHEIAVQNERTANNFDSNRLRSILEDMKKYASEKTYQQEQVLMFIKKLEGCLEYQSALEKKFDQLLLGHESPVLPADYFEGLEAGIRETKAERLPSRQPIYFPVGISKDALAWEKTFSGEQKSAKPIDAYGYLFWLNNQGKKVELVICDEIQKTNYRNLQGKTEPEALEISRKIGQQEAQWYQKIIDTYQLQNISIVGYQPFLERNREKFQKYKILIERWAQNSVWKKAFSAMVQESATKEADKESALPYAIEELSWILATDGTKISHLNEARYDALAAIIKSVEAYARAHRLDIFDPVNEERLLPIIKSSLGAISDLCNDRKSKTTRHSSVWEYHERIQSLLKNISLPKETPSESGFNKKLVEFNFACPEVGSSSFGWRQEGAEKAGTVKFKEPYSTYFYRGGADLFLDSDQVIAVADGQVGGKILTLEQKKQLEYARKVLQPILLHYFKVLASAPTEYFTKISKSREELLVECKKSATLSELLKFVQKNIVAPCESN